MSTCALPRVPLTWSFIPCRGSHSAVTQLRVILSCEPSFLRSASGSWVNVLGANSCAPITGYLPWGISTFPSYHARGSPLVMALSRVVSVPGSPSSVVDTSWARASPSGARLAASKPPSSSPYYCLGLSRPEASLGDASLSRAMLHFGRRLLLAMTRAVDLLTSLPWVPRGVPVTRWLWPSSTSDDGTVQRLIINFFNVKLIFLISH